MHPWDSSNTPLLELADTKLLATDMPSKLLLWPLWKCPLSHTIWPLPPSGTQGQTPALITPCPLWGRQTLTDNFTHASHFISREDSLLQWKETRQARPCYNTLCPCCCQKTLLMECCIHWRKGIFFFFCLALLLLLPSGNCFLCNWVYTWGFVTQLWQLWVRGETKDKHGHRNTAKTLHSRSNFLLT